MGRLSPLYDLGRLAMMVNNVLVEDGELEVGRREVGRSVDFLLGFCYKEFRKVF